MGTRFFSVDRRADDVSLPNLLIIGAMKCGTTSLHSYLATHPDVSMSEPKELNFFAANGNWARGRVWYAGHFDPSAKIRGESSPSYTFYPHARRVPERASDLVPDAQLIYLVRDPIDRIVAHYLHRVTAGTEDRSFDEVVGTIEVDLTVNGEEPERLRDVAGYLARSLYSRQLERWKEHFPDSQILVLDHEGLRDERQATLREVADFLGIENRFDGSNTSVDRNRTADKRRVSRFGRAVRRAGGTKVAATLPDALSRRLVDRFRRTFDHVPERPELSQSQRRKLVGLLGPDVERLRAYTGKPFSGWSV